jgi:hypothetical protein
MRAKKKNKQETKHWKNVFKQIIIPRFLLDSFARITFFWMRFFQRCVWRAIAVDR